MKHEKKNRAMKEEIKEKEKEMYNFKHVHKDPQKWARKRNTNYEFAYSGELLCVPQKN